MSDDDRLRKSGIRPLGAVPWGTHLCLFYETRQDLVDILAPYFRAGLEANEFCVWATSEPVTGEEAKQALTEAVPDFSRHLSAGDIEIVPAQEFYLEGDRFDFKRIIREWDQLLQQGLDRGYEGLRISGNAFWLGTEYQNDFTVYEEEFDRTLAGCRMIVACTYCLADSRAADLLDVARAHGVTMLLRNGRWEYVEAKPIAMDEDRLTRREVEVLEWVARGKSAWKIGEILGITRRTVDRHVEKAIGKLGASNRTQAVAIAICRRIIGASEQA